MIVITVSTLILFPDSVFTNSVTSLATCFSYSNLWRRWNRKQKPKQKKQKMSGLFGYLTT